MDELTDQSLFSDAEVRRSFPAPIAIALDVMVSEIETSGEVTTADETAAVIEATFLWLGRLWVAEYLHAIDRDASLSSEPINQELIERAGSARGVTTGRWVGLSRFIRGHLEGQSTVVEGLAAIPFGDVTGRLLHFRNHFSHGSFASTVEEIRVHRTLLHELLECVPALRTQLPLCRDAETGVIRAASGAWPEVDAPRGVVLPEAHPVIVGKGGVGLDLYPLLNVAYSAGGMRLGAPNKTHPISRMTERTALAAWLERYAHDQQGHLSYDSVASPQALPPGGVDGLRGSLSGLVLVEAYPGCGGGGAVAALSEDNPLGLALESFSTIRRICVKKNDLGQSGLTLARVVLRMTETALGEEPGSRKGSATDLMARLQQALSDLSGANKRVLLGIEDLHNGLEPYRGEPVTVREVYESLAGSTVTVVASTVPGGVPRPLFDHKIEVGMAEEPDSSDVEAWVRKLTSDRPLHRRVLQVLSKGEPSHLFSLCDALESDGGDTVFEPAVERALWDLRPMLQWERVELETESGQTERVRLWSSFGAVVGKAVAATGGET